MLNLGVMCLWVIFILFFFSFFGILKLLSHQIGIRDRVFILWDGYNKI